MCDPNIAIFWLIVIACLAFAVIAFIIYVVVESSKPKPGSDPPYADFRAGRAGERGAAGRDSAGEIAY